MSSRFAIIDFETTGLSPDYGDRITEVAVVIVESNKVIDQYASLVNSGTVIPHHIQRLTGITDQMVSNAPAASIVITKLNQFIKGATLVAHNASFDSKFFHSEMLHAGIRARSEFICTLLLSRRLYPSLANHKLATLAEYHKIKYQGRSHRALADALVTADLFIKINTDLCHHFSVNDLSPRKFLLSQREPIANFARSARLLKSPKKIQQILEPSQPVARINPEPSNIHIRSQYSPTAKITSSTWIKTPRGLQNKDSGLLIPFADTLRDVFPEPGYTVRGYAVGFIKDSDIDL